MTLVGVLMLVLGALLVTAGIENWSIGALLQGRIEKRS